MGKKSPDIGHWNACQPISWWVLDIILVWAGKRSLLSCPFKFYVIDSHHWSQVLFCGLFRARQTPSSPKLFLSTCAGVQEVTLPLHSSFKNTRNELEVSFLLTMYSMLLAAGLTDDRAALCSFTHWSINSLSVISGSETEHTEFWIIQAHTNTLTTLLMLLALQNTKTEGRNLRRMVKCYCKSFTKSGSYPR